MTGRILIADKVASNRIALRALLRTARYDPVVAASADDALNEARGTPPDLILVGQNLALEEDSGLLSRLKSDPRTQRIPRIALLREATPALRLAALRAGADDATGSPFAGGALMARIRSHLRAADTAHALGQREAAVRDLGLAEPSNAFQPPARVALITNDPARAAIWRDLLGKSYRHRVAAMAIETALSEADCDISPDIFVIEAALAHPGEALGLLAEYRARRQTRHAAIIVVHDPADIQTATMALDLGASDLLEAGFHPEELKLRIEIQLARKRDGDQLRATVDEGLKLALLDPLTGLFNRRYAMSHARRSGAEEPGAKGYCVILADIDRFKAINDTYGHAAGDAVLVAVARRLRDKVRGMDMVARIGGEEFLVYMPDPDPDTALAAAMRLCTELRAAPVELADGRPPIQVTASFGVAAAEPGEPLEAVIARADEALYAAKAAGRDTVTMAGACAA